MNLKTLFVPDRQMAARIVQLASPIVFAMLTQTFVNIADTFFVGKLEPSLSIPGQAALGYSLPLLWAVGGFLSAISVGTQAITARRFGADDHQAAGGVLTNSISIAVVSGIICSIGGFWAVPYAFPFLSSDAAVLGLGIPYAQIRMFGVLSMVATMSYKSFYDGIGKTHVHMVAAILMNVLNLVLNYGLIFGEFGLPRLEVEGAAWASLISTYVGLAIMVGWSLLPRYFARYRYYRLSKLNLKVSWEIVRLSVPSGLATVFVMSGFLMFFKIIGLLDEEAVNQTFSATGVYLGEAFEVYRAHQDTLLARSSEPGSSASVDWAYMTIQNRPAIYSAAAKVMIDVMSIAFISSLAFGTATATLVSQSLGQKRPDLAERYGWEAAKVGGWVMGVLGLLIVFFPETALDLISDDPVVIEAAKDEMRFIGFFVPLILLGFNFTQALFGAGNTVFVMWVEMSLHLLCLVPLTYLLSITFGMGFFGVWVAASVYIVSLTVIMMWKFWEGKWKKIEL